MTFLWCISLYPNWNLWIKELLNLDCLYQFDLLLRMGYLPWKTLFRERRGSFIHTGTSADAKATGAAGVLLQETVKTGTWNWWSVRAFSAGSNRASGRTSQPFDGGVWVAGIVDVIGLEGDSQTVEFCIGVGGHEGRVKDMAVARCGI